MNPLDQLLDQVGRKQLTHAELLQILDERGPVAPQQLERELRLMRTLAQAGAIDPGLELSVGDHLREVQSRAPTAASDANQEADSDYTMLVRKNPAPPPSSAAPSDDLTRVVAKPQPPAVAAPGGDETRFQPFPQGKGQAERSAAGAEQRSITGTDLSKSSAASSWVRFSERAAANPLVGTIPAAGVIIRGRFVLKHELGRGGMGVVFKALDRAQEEAHDRDPFIALKILNDEVREHPDSLIALQREAKRTQRLSHENIIRVHDFDRDRDLNIVYMTMEFVDGQDLRSYIKISGGRPRPLAEVRALINGMASALSYAHRQGIVHSDFKPSNVMLNAENIPKVFDFGIARATKHHGAQGDQTLFDAGTFGALTPAYASLEMMRGETPMPCDDVYALGCVTYELLAGKHPFDKKGADEVFAAKRSPLRPPGLTKRQWLALQRALALERAQRMKDPIELVEGLRHIGLRERMAPIAPVGAVAVLVAAAGAYLMHNLLYDHERKQAEAGFRGGSFTGLNQAVQALHQLRPEDQSVLLFTSEGPIVARYIEGAAQALIKTQPDLMQYRQAVDLVNDAIRQLYANNTPTNLSDFARALQQKFSQLQLDRIEQIKQCAAARQYFSSSPGQASVASLLLELKRADADENGGQAAAQKDALLQNFDTQLAAVQTGSSLDALNPARDALTELFGPADPLVASRTRDLGERARQFREAAAAQQQRQAQEAARAQALAALMASAQAQAIDLGALQGFLESQRHAQDLGVTQAQIDSAARTFSGRVARKLALANPQAREQIDAAAQEVAVALQINPADAALKQLQTSLQARLDAITSAKERGEMAVAQLGRLLDQPRPDDIWFGNYLNVAGELQRNIAGGLAARANLMPRAIAALLQSGQGAAAAQNFTLAGRIQAEIRHLAPGNKAVDEIGAAIADARNVDKQKALAAAQGDVNAFLLNPTLTGDARSAFDRSLPSVLADNSARSKELAGQLQTALGQQIAARIDARQFDVAQQYIALLRKIPASSQAADDLARRTAEARGAADLERAKSQQAATFNEIITEVNANHIRQARAKLDAFRTQYPGSDEVRQATEQVVAGLDALALQEAKANKADDRAPYQEALDLVKQALVYISAPDRIALRDKLANLVEIADARAAANAILAGTAGNDSGINFDAVLANARRLNPDKAPALDELIRQVMRKQAAPATAPPGTPATSPGGAGTGEQGAPANSPAAAPKANPEHHEAAAPAPAQSLAAGEKEQAAPSQPDTCVAEKRCMDVVSGSPNLHIALYRISAPQADTHQKGYAFSTTEISNADFNVFCAAVNSCSVDGNADMPRVNVTAELAQQYAQWLSAHTGFHYRLPTYAEWYAVATGADKQSANCPAGGELGQSYAQTPVDTANSDHGTARRFVKNIIGNVGEIVIDDAGGFVVAGGSVNDVNCSADTRHEYRGAEENVGFRLLREIDPP